MFERAGRKLVIAILGGSVVVVGLVMIVTPGPAFIVIPAGLAILGTEFVWARRVLKRMKEGAQALGRTIRGTAHGQSEAPADQRKSPDEPPAKTS